LHANTPNPSSNNLPLANLLSTATEKGYMVHLEYTCKCSTLHPLPMGIHMLALVGRCC